MDFEKYFQEWILELPGFWEDTNIKAKCRQFLIKQVLKAGEDMTL